MEAAGSGGVKKIKIVNCPPRLAESETGKLTIVNFNGEVAERLKARLSKSRRAATSSRVQIPASPPDKI